MDSFVPETEQTLKDGTVSKVSAEEIAALRGAKTVDDRMAVIQNSEGLSRQFLDSIEESIGKVAIREIVTKSERAVGFEEKAKANITGIDEAQGAFKNLTAEIGKETSLLAADRRHAAVIQKAEVTGGRATAGQVEKMVQETIDKMDLSGLDMDTQGTIRNRLRLGAMTGANPIDTGIQALEDAKQRRKLFGFIPAGGAVSEGDTQTADDTIAILRDMKAAQESQRQGVKAIAAQPEVKAGGQAAIVAEKRAEPITGTAIVEQAPAKSVDRSGLIAAQQTANEANADLTENKSGLTKQARQERADMANAALLEEQNRLMREQNELLKQQNQRPAQTPAPATVPVSVKVQAPATRPKEAPLPEKVQP
jgi:hypothetical protein